MQPRRLLALAAVAALVPVLSACGNKEAHTKIADTEGIYVDVGGLNYQVQISRQLNPTIPEDKTFLSGVADPQIDADQEWFAVFIRVQNDFKKAARSATRYEIVDTQGDAYRPVAIDDRVNPFGYRAGTVTPGEVVPGPDTVPAQTSIGGLELLFKIPRASTDNRPLVLEIRSPTNPRDVGEVDLDV
ncbi:MAG TPA: hypothetical protein VHB30_05430 [Solirubrobacteraceae bacterium]|jgi:hypothetical protein|nr:hypothetical protein [Solirubrobacteraceae bacterium]